MVVGGLSKSCLKVLSILANSYNNGFSQKELKNYTELSIRTIKYVLYILINRNLIYEELILSDIRNKKYFYGGK